MRGKKTNQELSESVRALYLVKNSVAEVARTLAMPRKTVEGIIKVDDEFAELRLQQKRKLILKAHQKAEEIIDNIDPSKAKSQSELAMTYGVLIDKNQALAGEQFKSSSVNVNVGDNRQVVFEVSPNLKKVIETKLGQLKEEVK